MKKLHSVLASLVLWQMAVPPAFAGPFDSSFDDLTSVSSSYGARDARIHPAALGFDSELNGDTFQTIFNAAVKPHDTDDYGVGFSYGPVGFSWERQSANLNKYQFSLGTRLTSRWFIGHRFSLNRFANPLLSFDSWDSGVQFRPSSRLALGLLVNRWNQPPSGGAYLPAEFVLGMTGQVNRFFRASLDMRTLSGSSEFFRRFQAQLAGTFTAANGIHLMLGYHSERQWQLGLQIDFDYGSVISNAIPRPANATYSIGMTSTTLPKKTVLAPSTILHVKIDSSLTEDGNPGSFFRQARPSLLSILDKLRRVSKTDNVRSVFVEIESFPLGLAAAQELANALFELRAQGIPVEAHIGQAGLKEYLIASGAAKIHMEPEGELRFLGVRSERYYLKGVLDKLGIEGQFLARGKYKSAPEMFTRTEGSPINRQNTLEELERAEIHVLAALKQTRGISTEKWKQMLKTALYSSQQAIDDKLIDGTLAFRGTKAKLREQMRLSTEVDRRGNELSLPRRVAVVVAEGNILHSRTPLLALGGQSQVTPDRFQNKLRRALRDDRTEAIVIRVSSPGGEVMASQELADLVKDAKAEKPVIVSMGDVAASGGYYLSAPADRIFASPLTLTGSVGVFLGKFQFAGLYRFLKVNKEILTRSPYPGLFSEDRAWSAEETAVLTKRLNTYYENFVGFVAKNRGLSSEKAEAAAQGRVWLGDQAKELNLADEIGGYLPALRYAAAACETDFENIDLWEIQVGGGLFPWSDEWAEAQTTKTLSNLIGTTATQDLIWAKSLEKNPYLYLSNVQKLE